jgi:hydrogenase maturation protease
MKSILIIGIGNTLRGDDGIGAYICQQVDKWNLPGLHTMMVHQLQTELLDEFLQYDHIIIADASASGEAVDFYPLDKEKTGPVAGSHHMNAAMLAALGNQLFKKDFSIMICAVKAADFEMGHPLSATALSNAGHALVMLKEWMDKLYV